MAKRAGAILLAVNDAWQWCAQAGCPADVLYAADAEWWRWHADVPDYLLPYKKYTIDPVAKEIRPTVELLNWRIKEGVDRDPTCLANGGLGGYHAINLAMHLGAKTILTLGYDLQPGPNGEHHCHVEHPTLTHPHYEERRAVFGTLVRPLRGLGITLLNVSRVSSIDTIPRASLAEALQ